MFSLFAFQSARVSVVRTKQPTLASFRAIHGVTTRTAPATTIPATSSDRPSGLNGHATNAASERAAAARAARSRGSRGPPREPAQRRGQDAAARRRASASRTTSASRSPSRISRFRCMSCQTRKGCSVAIVAPMTPTSQRDDAPPDLEDEHRGQRGDDEVGDPDDEPMALEHLVEPGQEPRVERLRVPGRPAREEAEGAARD